MIRAQVIVIATGLGTVISGLPAAEISVIFNQVSGHPKSLVPAGAGLPAGTTFRMQPEINPFHNPVVSPDGTRFLMSAWANLDSIEDECYIVWTNSGASTVAREGTTFGSPTGFLLGVGDRRMGINDAGQFVFGVDTGTNPAFDEIIVKWDGSAFVLAAREGDDVPVAPSENWGGVLDSAQILADGRVAWCGINTVGTLPGLQDDFCMAGNVAAVQSGQLVGAFAWEDFTEYEFRITPDGAHWLAVGQDTFPSNAQDRIMAVDGVVQAREATILPGSGYTSPVDTSLNGCESRLCNDGSYLMRGHNMDGEGWVLRNGVLVATTDDPITPGNRETFLGFFAITGNGVGDYIVGGITNNVDLDRNSVLVLNGEQVVVRENDTVDLDGNGLENDDAYVGTVDFDACVLTDALRLVFVAQVRNAAGTSLGHMVLSKQVGPAPLCEGDIAPPGPPMGDGTVNVADLLAVIGSWGQTGDPPADINGDHIVNVADLLAVIGAWGACP